MKVKKENRGGVREGAGRKPSYREKTTTLTVRLPQSKKEHIKLLVKQELEKLKYGLL